MDYIKFCQFFFQMSNIPITLLHQGKAVYCALADALHYTPDSVTVIYPAEHNPEFNSLSPDLEYGHVHIEGTDYDVFIGPLFSAPVNEQIIDQIIAEQGVSAAPLPDGYRENLFELMVNQPRCSHSQAIRYLRFLHYCLNQKTAALEDFIIEPDEKQESRRQQQMQADVSAQENDEHYNTYYYELQLYQLIRLGNVKKLKEYLDTPRDDVAEGTMARTPLRQAKNIMITCASRAVMMGAVPGGMDAERAYHLLDVYVLECEQMQTIEEVHRLQYIMLMDFCQHVSLLKKPDSVSAEIYRCMNYIRNHTNAVITIDDVANSINRSRSYTMRRFKAEVGEHINAYITRCKMEDACYMLIYDTTSLSEISAYLGFSSQSYFQNVFKKTYGITPMQYRKQNTIYYMKNNEP